ncbi:MAG: phosphoenolpyruvate--protein phosphotransferase [Endomicrobiia bacterium]|nr:phosphoenolpyruvate--protein phosphotransferase [Endomicrobiaceae bacterium]MDD3053166.1 phosphoenolpyruvate--protein phosphotransferase [Endomicrobiaceae bacterium]MDD3922061.1 phosphoenolpyruvate--protein phosphotransferase [Endomicrobiaceae bacterium]
MTNITDISNKTNIILNGVPASAGVAIGKVFILEDDDFILIEKEISVDKIQDEIVRFKEAIEKTRLELQENHAKLNDMLGENYAKIADAHLLILNDPIINKESFEIINNGNNAEYAIYKVVEKISRSFDLIDDEYFRERKHDIIDVAKKVIRHLLGKQKKTLADLDADSIVVAKNLTPSDTIAMREVMVRGFATDIGGRTSHTALVAQSLEIPAVVGLKNISIQAKQGMPIIVDGNQGIIILNPSDETIENYKREYEIQISNQKYLEQFKDLTATTLDGKDVTLAANIENPEEVRSVLKHGASGVGLYRSEFMYLSRKTMPTEEEHYQNYSKVAKMMMPYEVIIRTIDLGGDKISKLGLMDIGREANPFMGLRAIRLCLKYPEIFKVQLKGILRASMHGNIKIMYPMISRVSEIKEANEILEQAKQELRQEGKKFNESIQVGVMIEVPSAAVIADIIAKEVDFMSIGTNDLIQYTMAVDRINEDVAHLYDPLHLAILRLLKTIIDAGHAAGKEVGMCGEMAGDPTYSVVLLGLGLDEFSMSAAQIPKIKKIIRNVSKIEAKELVDELLKCSTVTEISTVMKKFKYR